LFFGTKYKELPQDKLGIAVLTIYAIFLFHLENNNLCYIRDKNIRITDNDNDLSLSVVLCSLFQRTKNILLLFFSKQNKTKQNKTKQNKTKQQNAKTKNKFLFFFLLAPR